MICEQNRIRGSYMDVEDTLGSNHDGDSSGSSCADVCDEMWFSENFSNRAERFLISSLVSGDYPEVVA